jgi:hypothetical protein
MNILFYSKNCSTSLNLLQLMKNENLIQHFKLICVETHMNNIPKDIKRVPTLIVKDIPKPLECADAFKWIENIKYIRHQNINKTNQIKQHIINKKSPHGYADLEMGGFSDEFAYLLTESAQPQSFVGCQEKNIIFTAPEQGKLSNNEQNNKIKDIQNIRKTQDDHIEKLFHNNIHSVINQNKN